MEKSSKRRELTNGEEVANVATHGIATALSVAGLALMLSYALTERGSTEIVSAAVFGAAMILAFLASTVYHAVSHVELKERWRKVDHSAIYLLIAGTYTPFTLIAIKGTLGWGLFFTVWSLAFAGVVFKVFFIHRFEMASLAIYVLMGWMGAIAFKPALAALNADGMAWLVAGGLCYTFGVLFYLWRQLPYHHAVWHCFVMGGSACHFAAIYFYVLPA